MDPLRLSILHLVFLLIIAGCSDSVEYQVVPVSGRVTLDGRPVADAHLTFQPIRTSSSHAVGPGSFGRTDGDGRYTLQLVDPSRPGAVVATHSVAITTSKEFDPESDYGGMTRDAVPPWYKPGGLSALTMEISGPTDNADFELTTQRP